MSEIFNNENQIIQRPCNTCVHFHRKNMKTISSTTFKDIPKEILSGYNMQTEPLPDQGNKIVYEPSQD